MNLKKSFLVMTQRYEDLNNMISIGSGYSIFAYMSSIGDTYFKENYVKASNFMNWHLNIIKKTIYYMRTWQLHMIHPKIF